MWHYYKRTFVMVQLAALAVGTMVYDKTRILTPAIVFFLFMQISAVLGAMWAHRLRRKIEAARRW
jgi:hypothetical protein